MKYCAKCGNKLSINQKFCNKCGHKIDDFNTKYHLNNQYQNENNHKKTNHNIWLLLGIILGIILLGALFFAGIKLYQTFNESSISDFQDGNSNSQKNKINILSSDFNEQFMKKDNTFGFNGFNLGMSKNEVEKKFGEAQAVINLDIGEVYKYDNIGVYYGIDNTISTVYVLPTSLTVEDFVEFHGEPKFETEDQLIYDDNPNNGFSIIVNTRNGMVDSIENTYQIKR